MNVQAGVLLGILLSSLVTGGLIFFLKPESHRLRTWLNLLGAGLKLVLVLALLAGVQAGHDYAWSFSLGPGLEFALGADANSVSARHR